MLLYNMLHQLKFVNLAQKRSTFGTKNANCDQQPTVKLCSGFATAEQRGAAQ